MHTGLPTPVEVDDRKIADIVRDLVQDVGRLMKDEIVLAKTELGDSARHVRAAAGVLTIAGVVGLFAGACLIAAGIAALALILPVWLAALLPGAGLAIVAAGAYLVGRNKLERVDLAPRRTITTLKENMEWAKQRT